MNNTELPQKYTSARNDWEKAYIAISIARKKNSVGNSWEWANIAIRHMELCGIKNAREIAGICTYPDVEALDSALATLQKDELVIVTHHQGLVDWLNEQGYNGNVINHATPQDVLGKHVIGKLPMYMAAIAQSITQVHIPNLPEHMWGEELTSNDLTNHGAYMRTYIVKEISIVKPFGY